MMRNTRLQREFQLLDDFKAEGISLELSNNLDRLQCTIIGPEGTPFESQSLSLEICPAQKYALTDPKTAVNIACSFTFFYSS